MNNLLSVRGVYVSYGGIIALQNINVEVKEVEVVGIIGPNGAGKTTLLNAISGIVPFQSGEIYFLERFINNLEAYQITRLGIAHIPERRGIFHRMTVTENLLLGGIFGENKSETKKNIENIYAIFPILKERKDQIAGTLSGGEQQMLAIARALMFKPKLLMMDEPSLGLAPLLVRHIFEKIDEMRKKRITILLVEQNARQTFKIADRVYVFQSGKIFTEGRSNVLIKDDAIVKAYLGETKV
jgi:branched-chain amino acid transport system ATP-binding protein